MEDGDIVDVHMEQLGGGCASSTEDSEDWVFVATDEDLLQRTLTEKARLLCTVDRLKKELNALKADNRALANTNRILADNNRGLAQEYSVLKQDAKALNVRLKPR